MASSLFVLALALAGSMVGIEIAVGILVTTFDRLPDGGGLLARADAARTLGRIMPLWYAATVVMSLVCAALVWGSPTMAPTLVAAVLFVAGILMSVVLLVPINTRAASWTPSDAPSDWRDQLRRWDRIHLARTVVVSAGFVLLAVGAVQ